MSRDSDYQSLLALKRKEEALDAAWRNVEAAKSEIASRKNAVNSVSVQNPSAPSKPSADHSESRRFAGEHYGSAATESKKKIRLFTVAVSVILFVMAIVGFELARRNGNTFGVMLLKGIYSDTEGINMTDNLAELILRIAAYLGGAIVAFLNIRLCKLWMNEKSVFIHCKESIASFFDFFIELLL